MGSSPSIVFPPSYPTQEDIRVRHTAMRNVDRYFVKLHEKIALKQKPEEVVHIRDGVESHVRNLLTLAENVDPRFRVCSDGIVKIGSVYEGTKLCVLDEFNYALELAELSFHDDDIKVEDLNHPENGFDVKVFVEEKKGLNEFAESWKSMIQDQYLVGKRSTRAKKDGILDTFFKLTRKVHGHASPIETKFGILKPLGLVELFGNHIRLKLTLTQQWEEYRESKRFQGKTVHEVIVTLTPVIRWTHLNEFLFEDDPVNETIYNEAISADVFHLTPCESGNFRKWFPVIETRVMKSVLPKHIKAFCVVKFLFNGMDSNRKCKYFRGLRLDLVDSYALKMIFLSLVDTCPCLTYSEYELYDCVMHMLNHVYDRLYDLDTSGACTIYRHVVIQRETQTSCDQHLIGLHKSALTEMLKHDLKFWIGEKEKYDLSKDVFGLMTIVDRIENILQNLNPGK
ncbi:hypothetical protein DPMN_149514 [Dreissena polymorpha]|uniref:Uncharacterized protein n=1 Tax=Dreissena polymorpha TaxID=45954 RepID=A0A9D4J5D7_DREPO|nr:hypothetical protein DPMN_149514 [Dreissena polymorpha]